MQKNPHKTLRVYSEQLYANKLDNLEEIDNFQKHTVHQKGSMKTQSLKRPVTRSDICCCCCPALCGPMDRSTPASSVITISRSLLKFVSIELVMLSNHLIFCHPLLLLPSIFPRSETESVKDKIKTPHKKTSRTGWLYWGILTNIQRTYTDPSQTLPKD